MLAIDAQRAVASVAQRGVTGKPWVRLTCVFTALADTAAIDFAWFDSAGAAAHTDDDVHFAEWLDLREAMVDDHGVWFSAILNMERDGTYEFTFNYQDPIDFEEGTEDGDYVIDMARFPRPWEEIPEWHPVKKHYTSESWATELARTD